MTISAEYDALMQLVKRSEAQTESKPSAPARWMRLIGNSITAPA